MMRHESLRLLLELSLEKRKSQVYKIENSVKNKLLRRGHTDAFKFVTKPLGPLRDVIVGHHPKPGQKKTKKNNLGI